MQRSANNDIVYDHGDTYLKTQNVKARSRVDFNYDLIKMSKIKANSSAFMHSCFGQNLLIML